VAGALIGVAGQPLPPTSGRQPPGEPFAASLELVVTHSVSGEYFVQQHVVVLQPGDVIDGSAVAATAQGWSSWWARGSGLGALEEPPTG
jgi:hypothetical protein